MLPPCGLLQFDLTRFLDEVANRVAAGSEEVGTNVTGDVVAAMSVFSVKHLLGGWALQQLGSATTEK